MSTKRRLSASVDAELLASAHRAVTDGRAESVSAWVNDALVRKAEDDIRLLALDDFLERWEAEHGEITESEMSAASRRARAGAVVVRGQPNRPAPGRRRRRGAA